MQLVSKPFFERKELHIKQEPRHPIHEILDVYDKKKRELKYLELFSTNRTAKLLRIPYLITRLPTPRGFQNWNDFREDMIPIETLVVFTYLIEYAMYICGTKAAIRIVRYLTGNN